MECTSNYKMTQNCINNLYIMNILLIYLCELTYIDLELKQILGKECNIKAE